VAGRGWTSWAYMPASLIQYDGEATQDEEVKTEAEQVYTLGSRLLKLTDPLMTGNDVKELQTHLNSLKFDCGQADGEFGGATKRAVEKFQTAAGNLVVDGEYGIKSHEALMKMLEGNEDVASDNMVTILGNAVNIRKGPGTSYGVLKSSYKGDKFERVSTSGWVCVQYNNAVYWASTNYIANGVCTVSELNVRKGPATTYGVVGTVRRGYKFVDVNTNGWIPILVDGAVYWVSAKYAG
jgi:uncharacterized protein YraI